MGCNWGYNPLTNHLLTSWDIQVGAAFELEAFLKLHPAHTFLTYAPLDELRSFRFELKTGRRANKVVDLALNQAAKPWFHQYLDPAWYHLWRIVSENVFWGQICNFVKRIGVNQSKWGAILQVSAQKRHGNLAPLHCTPGSAANSWSFHGQAWET